MIGELPNGHTSYMSWILELLRLRRKDEVWLPRDLWFIVLDHVLAPDINYYWGMKRLLSLADTCKGMNELCTSYLITKRPEAVLVFMVRYHVHGIWAIDKVIDILSASELRRDPSARKTYHYACCLRGLDRVSSIDWTEMDDASRRECLHGAIKGGNLECFRWMLDVVDKERYSPAWNKMITYFSYPGYTQEFMDLDLSHDVSHMLRDACLNRAETPMILAFLDHFPNDANVIIRDVILRIIQRWRTEEERRIYAGRKEQEADGRIIRVLINYRRTYDITDEGKYGGLAMTSFLHCPPAFAECLRHDTFRVTDFYKCEEIKSIIYNAWSFPGIVFPPRQEYDGRYHSWYGEGSSLYHLLKTGYVDLRAYDHWGMRMVFLVTDREVLDSTITHSIHGRSRKRFSPWSDAMLREAITTCMWFRNTNGLYAITEAPSLRGRALSMIFKLWKDDKSQLYAYKIYKYETVIKDSKLWRWMYRMKDVQLPSLTDVSLVIGVSLGLALMLS